MPDSSLFPYLPTKNLRGETAWRPVLPFELTYRAKTMTVSGLVDSGADVNVLPYDIGLELGAVWEAQKRIIELSGNLAHHEARGILLSARVAPFAPVVQLAFAWTRAEYVSLILGQVNFLREFNVSFFGSQREFEVRLRSST
jgi:hypothetical protein